MLNNESWDTLSQSFEFEPRAHFVETLFVACSDYVVDGNYISFRFALADRVRIQTAVDSIVAAQVPFYFTIEQGLFDSECNRVIYEFNISDLFFFIYARFSGSCGASRSLSSRRPKKRKTPSKGQKHNNWRTTPVVVDLDF
jgi:hypothetical protein